MSEAPAATLAATRTGKVQGRTRDGIHVFKGIPFAAPPIGELRFRPPAPALPWDDTLDATHSSPWAPQLPSPLEKMLGAPPPRWDEAGCLTLNVFTPGLDDARRPVMVWIHGGAFVNGAGSSPIYDGRRFAAHGDVVVVTINYRLGAFGFLHLDEIFGDEFSGSGNAGILDQALALEWVRDNIESFGGDPGRVTIFGESAGGMSVGTLLGLPAADGLFHRAIVQSGSASNVSTAGSGHQGRARRSSTTPGSPRSPSSRPHPPETILDAQKAVLAHGLRTDLPFAPVADGKVVPDQPVHTIGSGRTGNVPTMVGTNADEMTLFLAFSLGTGGGDSSAIARKMARVFGDRADEAIALYAANRPDGTVDDALVALATDRVFRIPSIRLAEAQAAQGRTAFMYLFTWPSPVYDGKLKSTHALELPFMWDAIDKPGLSALTGDGADRQPLADAMHAAWISFARTGDPGWAAYDTTRRATQRFDTTLEVLDDPMGDERELWTGIL